MRTLEDVLLNGGTETEIAAAYEQQMSNDISRWMNIYLRWWVNHNYPKGHQLPLALRIGWILETMPAMQDQSMDSVVKLAEAYKNE